MRCLLLVGLLLVGCGKGEEKQTRFKPSELLVMKKLPIEPIDLVGKIAMADMTKEDAKNGKVMVIVEDDVVSTKKHNNYISVVFESGNDRFSEAFVDWVKNLKDGKYVRIRGKALRVKDTVFLNEAEVQ